MAAAWASDAPNHAHALRLDRQPTMPAARRTPLHRVGEHVGHVPLGDGLGLTAARAAGVELALAVYEQRGVVLDVRTFPVVEPLGGDDVSGAVVDEPGAVFGGPVDGAFHCSVVVAVGLAGDADDLAEGVEALEC